MGEDVERLQLSPCSSRCLRERLLGQAVLSGASSSFVCLSGEELSHAVSQRALFSAMGAERTSKRGSPRKPVVSNGGGTEKRIPAQHTGLCDWR